MPGFAEFRTDEREQLLAYLAAQRELLHTASYGLTDEQARLTPSAGSLSIGGLVKHLGRAETTWSDLVAGQHAPYDPEAVADYEEGFRLGPDETLKGALAEYEAVAAETDRIARSLPLDHEVPVPEDVPWMPKDVEVWNVRWALLHLIEETARHAGHADIVRESIDGATWFPLMAAATDWTPPVPWITPWSPSPAA